MSDYTHKERPRSGKLNMEKRGVGGMARHHKLKAQVGQAAVNAKSTPPAAPPAVGKPAAKPPTIGRPAVSLPVVQPKPAAKKQPVVQEPDEDVADLFDLPEPGEQPQGLLEAAAAKGKANPFSNLARKIATKPQADEGEEVTAESLAKDALDVDKRKPKKRDGAKVKEGADALLDSIIGLSCNRCPLAETCPAFKEDHECGLEESYDSLSIGVDRGATIGAVLDRVANLHLRRALRAVHVEAHLTGGQLNAEATRQLEVAAQAAIRAAQVNGTMPNNGQGTTQRATITVEQTTQGAPAQQGGVLQSLMQQFLKPREPEPALEPATIVVQAEPPNQGTAPSPQENHEPGLGVGGPT